MNTPLPPTDFKDTLEEMRASVAAREARGRLAGTVQAVFLKLLGMLLALLADLRARRLAAEAADAGAAVAAGQRSAQGVVAAGREQRPTSPRPSPPEGGEGDVRARGRGTPAANAPTEHEDAATALAPRGRRSLAGWREAVLVHPTGVRRVAARGCFSKIRILRGGETRVRFVAISQ